MARLKACYTYLPTPSYGELNSLIFAWYAQCSYIFFSSYYNYCIIWAIFARLRVAYFCARCASQSQSSARARKYAIKYFESQARACPTDYYFQHFFGLGIFPFRRVLIYAQSIATASVLIFRQDNNCYARPTSAGDKPRGLLLHQHPPSNSPQSLEQAAKLKVLARAKCGQFAASAERGGKRQCRKQS